MSSPPRTTGGRRMMTGVLVAHPSACRDTSERDASLAGYSSLPSEPSHYAHFCALSRYGVTTVRSFPHADFSVASGMSAATRSGLFRAEIERCFRRMPTDLRLPRFGVLRPVGLPSALPSPALPKASLRTSWIKEVGFRRYKPILVFLTDTSIALPRSCPKAQYGPRYQTAGSIGALARDEPVTPGVTFLSHPAPNSEDLNDR